MIEQVLLSLFAGGNSLIVGVPGLAKTLLIATLARSLSMQFSRIQFTPDLMPSDITGTEVMEEDRSTGARALRFVRGPVFANLVLADEINRTPPKTQAALLEAMQERQVTVGGVAHRLPSPFFVLATQNPIEQEGTYPLPEAQLDRFMLNIRIGYPSEAEELEIVTRTTGEGSVHTTAVMDAAELARALVEVFLTPESLAVLEQRLKKRGKDAPEVIKKRLAVAKQEIAQWKHFDYLLLSTSVREDVRRMQAIYDAEKMRQARSFAPEL